MRDAIKILSLIALFLAAVNLTTAGAKEIPDSPVEVIEVKDLGVSANDDSKSIVEVRWRINPSLHANAVSFSLTLSITYADGTVTTLKKQANANANSIRFELPSARVSGGKPPAFIKRMNAVVIAVNSKIIGT